MPELVLLKATMSEMTPTFESEMLLFGFCRLGWLRALNTSQVKRRPNFSVSLKFLCNPQSASNRRGPRSEFRLVSPKVNGAGAEKAPGLNQQFADRVVRPFGHVPENGLPVRSGRSVMSKVFKLALLPCTTEKGRPLSIVVIPVHCQPPKIAFANPLEFDPQRWPCPKGSITV